MTSKKLHQALPELSLGTTVRRLRKTAKISQENLAKLLDIHQTAVCRIEKNVQSLSPEQLYVLSRHFGVKVDNLLAGRIDFWGVAEKFNQAPPVPRRYREFPFSKVREFLPMLYFAKQTLGAAETERMLAHFNIDESLFQNPDMTIGVNCNLDVTRHLIEKGHISKKSFEDLVDQTRKRAVHGFLNCVYESQEASLALMQTWILNSRHYESNFRYEIEAMGKGSLEVSVAPRGHMEYIPYKDDVLGDFLCRYKKAYFAGFPRYIEGKPLTIVEEQCHFHGHGKCVYRIAA